MVEEIHICGFDKQHALSYFVALARWQNIRDLKMESEQTGNFLCLRTYRRNR